jgi:hypothetical protein
MLIEHPPEGGRLAGRRPLLQDLRRLMRRSIAAMLFQEGARSAYRELVIVRVNASGQLPLAPILSFNPGLEALERY